VSCRRDALAGGGHFVTCMPCCGSRNQLRSFDGRHLSLLATKRAPREAQTSHEVTAARVGRSSGRTAYFKARLIAGSGGRSGCCARQPQFSRSARRRPGMAPRRAVDLMLQLEEPAARHRHRRSRRPRSRLAGIAFCRTSWRGAQPVSSARSQPPGLTARPDPSAEEALTAIDVADAVRSDWVQQSGL